MRLSLASALLVAGLAVRSMAGDPPSLLCNRTSADANGTFFSAYNPHVKQGPEDGQPENTSGQTLDVGVGLTLSQNFETNKVEYSLWYNTNGANYDNDTELGYDVCAISWSPTPYDTQVRGQSDNGSCYSMFDQGCVAAVETAASKYALQFYQSLSDQTNSSSISSPLALICGDIATSLNANLPTECSSFVNSSTSFAPAIALTGEGSLVYEFNCPMNGTLNGTESTYNLLQTKTDPWSTEAYDYFGTYAWPLVAVWMPVSTGKSQYSINDSVTGMLCGRIDNYSQGSYVPTPLEAASNTTTSSTPSASPSAGSSSGLSGGAIAGIVVGVVAFVAILLGLLFFLLQRRRKSRKPEEIIHEKDSNDTLHEAPTNDTAINDTGTIKTVGSLSEAPDTAISELPPDGDITWAKRQELDAGKEHEVFELPGEEGFVQDHGDVSTDTASPGSRHRRLSDLTE